MSQWLRYPSRAVTERQQINIHARQCSSADDSVLSSTPFTQFASHSDYRFKTYQYNAISASNKFFIDFSEKCFHRNLRKNHRD